MKRIILIEDSPPQDENLKFSLEDLGFKVTVAKNAEEAISLLQLSPPDLIITDVIMPNMDGFTLCAKIKDDPEFSRIPVLLLTSLNNINDVLKGLAAGADNFISKPIDDAALQEIIRDSLGESDTYGIVKGNDGLEIGYDGATYSIHASREKILSFLLSTYKTAILKNNALVQATKELNHLNRTLESQVAERTRELAHEVEVRKKAQDQILRREQVLMEITEHLNDPVFKTDPEGIYIWVNPAHFEIFQYEPQKLIGRSFLEFVHPEDQEKIITLLHNPEGVDGGERIEYKFRHANVHYLRLECPPSYTAGDTSHTGSMVFAAHEITQHKDFQNNLLRAKEKAEKSDLLKSSFLANMSHDIRTPMNAIIGFAELMKDKGLQEEDQQRFLDQITKNGESLLNLVNDIIDVSKIEAGALKVHATPCAINHIMDDLFEYYQRLLELKGKTEVKLEMNKGFPGQDKQIMADPLRFRQIMSNLLSNAVKFTKTGKIRFGYSLIDEKVIEFYVSDSGIGISRADHDKIFTQFSQLESVRDINQEGTGLGLTISMNLTRLMGGKMWVESQLGQGSTFYFTIPYDPVDKPVVIRKKQQIVRELPDLSDKKILIVEDDFSSYSYLQASLNRCHAQILWAKDGEQAVNFCKDDPDIDLVLMDIQLPKLTGYEAVPIIKANRPDLPIIAQTAYTMSGEEKKCYEVGCDDYLPKPIIPGELISMVKRYLLEK